MNCAFQLKDSSTISQGKQLAEQALTGSAPNQPLHFQCLYNVVNALSALCDLGLPDAAEDTTKAAWEQQLIENRIETRQNLREARRKYFEVGSSEIADRH